MTKLRPEQTQYPTASVILATDSLKNLTSLIYSNSVVGSAIVQRNSDGTIAGVTSAFTTIAPLGGGSDDGAHLTTVLASLSGVGGVQLVRGATYSIQTTITVPTDIVFDLNGAKLVSTVSGSYPLTGSVIRAGKGSSAAATTLASTPTAGGQTISVTSATGATVGGFVYLNSTTTGRSYIYQIERISGTTLTLERPLPLINNFASADTATFYAAGSIPKNIFILGGGATIEGTSVVAISLQSARYSIVENIRFINSTSTSPSDAFGVFNDGCYRCIAKGLDAQGYDTTTHAAAGAPSVGIAIQGGEECVISDSTVRYGANHGFGFVECYRCIMSNVHASGCSAFGIQIANDIVTTHGSDFCMVIDSSFNNNGSDGVITYYGSSHCSFVNVDCHNNTGNGFTIGDGTTGSISTSLVNCRSRSNAQFGVKIAANSKGTRLSNVEISENSNCDLTALDEVWASGLFTTNSVVAVGQLWNFSGNFDYFIDNFKIVHGASGAAVGCVYLTAGRLHISNGLVTLGHASDGAFWIPSGTGKVCINNVRVDPNGQSSTLGVIAQAGTFEIGVSVDVSACATPYDMLGGIVTFIEPQDYLEFFPTGGDDAPAFASLLASAAGKKVVMLPGTYHWNTTCLIPSNSWIVGNPDVLIISTIAPVDVGDPVNSCFYNFLTTAGTATTLSSPVSIGTYTATVAAPGNVAVGDTVLLSPSGVTNVNQILKCVGKVGSVLTFDAPIEFAMSGGSQVQSITRGHDIKIEGRGMTFTGTGSRAIEFAAVENCIVEGVRVIRDSGHFTSITMSYDIAGRNNVFRDIYIDGYGTQCGLALECNVGSSIENCFVSGATATTAACGYYLPTSKRCRVTNCISISCYNGISIIQSGTGDLESSQRCSISDCQFIDNTSVGVMVQGGKDLQFSNVTCERNGFAGFSIANGLVLAESVQMTNCYARSNTTTGFLLEGKNLLCTNCVSDLNAFGYSIGNDALSSVSNVALENCSANSNSQCPVFNQGVGAQVLITNFLSKLNQGGLKQSVAGHVMVDGWYSEDDSLGGLGLWENSSTGYMSIARAHVKNVTGAVFWGGIPDGTGTTILTDYVAEMAGGSGIKAIADVSGACTLICKNVKVVVTSGTFTYGLYEGHAVACKVFLDQLCDFSAAATPILQDAQAAAGSGFIADPTSDFTIKQGDRTTNSGTGATLKIQAQNETGTTSTGGSLVLQSGSGTTANGVIQFNSGTHGMAQMSEATTSTLFDLDASKTFWFVRANGAGQSFIFQATTGSMFFDAPTFFFRDGSFSTVIQWTMASGGASSAVVAASVTSFTISQADKTTASGTGATLTIQAQNETGTTSTGGSLSLQSGTGTSANGFVNIYSGTTQLVQYYLNGTSSGLAVSSGRAGLGIVTGGSGQYIQLQATNGAGVVYLDTPTVKFRDTAAADTIVFTLAATGTTSLQFATGINALSISQADKTTNSGTGATFTIQAQNETGTGSTGGDLSLKSGTGTTTQGSIDIVCGTQTIGKYQSLGAGDARFTADVSASFILFAANAAGQQVLFQAIGSGGSVTYETGTVTYIDASLNTAMSWSLNGTGTTALQFNGAVTLPEILQAQKAGTGATVGATMKIMAQDGQNQTGINNNNSGGDLWLAGGAPGTGGSGEIGTFPGGIQFAGGSQLYVRLDSIGFTIDKNYGDFTISQPVRTGTGGHVGGGLFISAQAGQAVPSGTNNNGGDISMTTGAAGTGGTGGHPGVLNLALGNGVTIFSGTDSLLTIGDTGGLNQIDIDAALTINLNMSGVTALTADNNSVQFYGGAGDGGGAFLISIADCNTPPSTNPSGGGIMYSEGGALKWRGSGGSITTIAPA